MILGIVASLALAQGIPLKDGVGSNLAGVDANTNLKVNLPTTLSQAGYVGLVAVPQAKAISSFGPMGRLAVGTTSLDMFDPIDGTAINTNIWTTANVTMTTVQNTSSFIVLNAAASTAISASAQITSIKQMQLINTFVPTVRILFKTPNVPQANATMEMGFGTAAGTTAPTDGCYFRWSSDGTFYGVSTFNSVDTLAAFAAPTINITHTAHIVFRGTGCEYWIDDVKLGQVNNPAGNASPTSSSRIPVLMRVYNAATAPTVAPQLHISAVSLFRNDLMSNKPWAQQMISIGRGAYQSPVTTFTQTANHANSTGPVSAALSNTAAGYTTLGGQYQFAAPAGAPTDFALFGFQVPVGYQFIAKQLQISACNTGAAVAITPTMLQWSIGLNASAVSLATADGVNTWAPRRVDLGLQGLLVGDAIGRCADPITLTTGEDPIGVVDSGRFFHVILQAPVGTATVGQVIRGTVTVLGYFE